MADLLQRAREIWAQGGWTMIALALNAFVLAFLGSNLWIKLKARRFRRLPEKLWREWIVRPELRRGSIGEQITLLMGARDVRDLRVRYNEMHAAEVAPYTRDLKFMRRAVGTAPLLGLLGTVTGMLATFQALASGAGGDKTMEMIASGISEALITTETGLVIALPGLFFQYHLTRERDRYEAFLAHLQTACTQAFCAARRRKPAEAA